MIFQGLSVARNCLRPETAPLTILAIKRGFFCNFAKTFKVCHLMGQTQQTFLVFQDVFKTYLQYVFLKRLQDVFKTCLQDVLLLCLQDVLEDKKMLH